MRELTPAQQKQVAGGDGGNTSQGSNGGVIG